MSLGADAAFIFVNKKNEVRISARSTRMFQDETGIHLGRDIMEKVGPILSGTGGGHAGAAGANGKKNVNGAKEFILKYLKTVL